MENKDKEKLLSLLSDEAREYNAAADWYDYCHAQSLAALYRYAQKTICDFIDIARDECETFDEIDEMLDTVRNDYFNRYKFFQCEHFDRLAEFAMFGYMALGEVESLIER